MKEIFLKNVRLSFPSLFQTTAFENGEPKYEATFLIPKEGEAHKALRAGFQDVIAEQWGTKMPSNIKYGVHDGDQKEYDGYSGHMYIKATSKKRPTVIHRDKSPITDSDGTIYAGCYVNAVITVFAWDNKFGKGINAFLNGVQFVSDGEPFGSKFDADKAFPALENNTNGYAEQAAVKANAEFADNVPDADLPF